MDNIVSHITRAYTETKTSAKTGNPYTTLVLEFNKANGKTYKYTSFLNDDQISIIEDTVAPKSASEL